MHPELEEPGQIDCTDGGCSFEFDDQGNFSISGGRSSASGKKSGDVHLARYADGTVKVVSEEEYNKHVENGVKEENIKDFTLNALQSKLSFDKLRDNFSDIKHSHFDKKGNECFSNYCAINLSEALRKSEIKLVKFEGATCWGCDVENGSHAIRATELAKWLLKNNINGVGKVKVLNGSNYADYVRGKTGVIYFEDFWVRKGQTSRTGDHIDLWNKNELESIGTFLTWIRRTFPGTSEAFFDMSDLTKSKRVYFWEMK